MSRNCPECARLRKEGWSLYAEPVAAKDELALTRKNDPMYVANNSEVRSLDRLMKEAFPSLLHPSPRAHKGVT